MTTSPDLARPARFDNPARRPGPSSRTARRLLANRVAPVGPEAVEDHVEPPLAADTAPVVREILREVEPVPERRPVVHVGG